jgi:hypothetical protein
MLIALTSNDKDSPPGLRPGSSDGLLMVGAKRRGNWGV